MGSRKVLRRLYKTADDFLSKLLAQAARKGDVPACLGVGCSFCCYDVSAITPLEARGLMSAYHKLPADKRERVARQLQRWWALHEEEDALVFRDHTRLAKAAQVAAEHGTPCMFLLEGRCSVYEMRPLACRGHFSFEEDPQACDDKNRGLRTIRGLNQDQLRNWLWGEAVQLGLGKPKQELHAAMRHLIQGEA